MQLIFVRHALPVRQVLDSGRADPALSSTGSAQAVALGDWLGREPVDAVATSPARRAVETAAPLARRCRLTPVTIADLDEFDAGSASYVPVEEMRATGDPRWHLLRQGRLYGTDSEAREFRARVVAAVESLVAAHPARRVAVVCHGGVINAYLGHILGIDTPLWFSARYTGISRVLASRSGRRSLVTLNETPHLARDDLRVADTEPPGVAPS
jgi:broad specificity phosphatase PhoE